MSVAEVQRRVTENQRIPKKRGFNRIGLYRIHWIEENGGGTSVASIGVAYDGSIWYAPANWTSDFKEGRCVAWRDWERIERVEWIEGQ